MSEKIGQLPSQAIVRTHQTDGMDIPYNSQILGLAAYMHDWGAFPCYAQKRVEHAIRSNGWMRKVLEFYEADSRYRMILSHKICPGQHREHMADQRWVKY